MTGWQGQATVGGQLASAPLQLTGASFTGNNGAKNRTYTLPTAAQNSVPIIAIDQAILIYNFNFSFSSKVITILDNLDNASKVSIYYQQVV
jgi:hypothetical protein